MPGMPRQQRPLNFIAWIRWRWLRWRWIDARREIEYWRKAGVPSQCMRNLREYEEQLACAVAAMEAKFK